MPKLSHSPYFQRLSKIIILILLVIVAILLILFYQSLSVLTETLTKSGFNFVKKIEYDKSKWYDQEPSALWNFDRRDYVFPSDRLHYLVLLDSKMPYPIDITSNMQIFIGDKNVTAVQTLPSIVHLDSNHNTGIIEYNFTAREGGLNTVKVNLKIINGTNRISLENKTEILKFDVQSQAIQLQVESNKNTQLGIALSASTAIVTVLILIYQTAKLRDEKKQTLRPWIGETNNGIDIGKFYNNRNEFKLLKQWNEMTEPEKIAFHCTHVDWSITMKNFGQIPAFNVQSRLLAVYNLEPTKERFGEFAGKFVIMPNNEYKVMYRIDAITSYAIQNPALNPYLCFDFKYGSSPSKQEYRYGFTASMTGGTGYKIRLTWDEKSYEKINSILLDNLSND